MAEFEIERHASDGLEVHSGHAQELLPFKVVAQVSLHQGDAVLRQHLSEPHGELELRKGHVRAVIGSSFRRQLT